jgi:hypothetical protein
MSVHVICPTCGSVAVLHRPPVTACARCETPFPDQLRHSATQTLLCELAPKPLLLTLGQWASVFAGAVLALLFLLAPFNIGTYNIGDEIVPGPEWLRRGGWVFAVVGALLLAIGIGLWRERPWVRPLMLAYWVSMLLVAFGDSGIAVEDVVGLALFAAVGVAVSAWYLYFKPNVQAYFAARRAGSPDRGGIGERPR